MNIKELQCCEYFSSDFNSNTLLYSEKDGSIVCNMNKLNDTDHLKKYVKFYPPDSFVFTTTSPAGLSVWERATGKSMFSYEKEHLYEHCYSDACILSAFDDFGIKFYDLRTRYSTNTYPHPNVTKLAWNADMLLCLDNKQLSVLDSKTGGRILYTVPNVFDFCICNNKLYYLTKTSKTVTKLTETSIVDANQATSMSKNVHYKKIQSTAKETILIGYIETGIKIEKTTGIIRINLPDIEPVKVHVAAQDLYVFSKEKLYSLGSNEMY